jgi:hypothetical protein
MLNRLLCGFFLIATCAFTNGSTEESLAEEKTSRADDVMPLNLPEQTNPEVRKAQDRIYLLAERQARYLMSLVHPWSDDSGMKLTTQSKSLEHFIRPNTAVIGNFAFLYRFGPYDEKLVGVSRAELLETYIIPMMRYITATHLTGSRPTSDGKKWGNHWQSAYWAQMFGRSAWWIWADLPDDLHQGVRRVVAGRRLLERSRQGIRFGSGVHRKISRRMVRMGRQRGMADLASIARSTCCGAGKPAERDIEARVAPRPSGRLVRMACLA